MEPRKERNTRKNRRSPERPVTSFCSFLFVPFVFFVVDNTPRRDSCTAPDCLPLIARASCDATCRGENACDLDSAASCESLFGFGTRRLSYRKRIFRADLMECRGVCRLPEPFAAPVDQSERCLPRYLRNGRRTCVLTTVMQNRIY